MYRPSRAHSFSYLVRLALINEHVYRDSLGVNFDCAENDVVGRHVGAGSVGGSWVGPGGDWSVLLERNLDHDYYSWDLKGRV